MCYGELNLKPWEIERLTLGDIFDMLDGWQRRYDRLEDLFINWITYPNVSIAAGKRKKPKLETFYAHRRKRDAKALQSELEQDLKEEFDF